VLTMFAVIMKDDNSGHTRRNSALKSAQVCGHNNKYVGIITSAGIVQDG
jgi:hypothetical protein